MADPSVPMISIIVPFLNVEAFLAEAVESVLAQTHTNWELLLVDDGSRDGSRAIAERYRVANPERVRCLEHEGRANRGISASRNLGRRHAAGSLIAFLDADDRWTPEKLSIQAEILAAHPEVDLVVGATRYWFSWSGRPEDRDKDVLLPVGGPQDAVVRPPDLIPTLYPLGTGAAPSMNTVLVRAKLLDRIGGFEDRFRTAFEDQAFLVKVYLVSPVYVSARHLDDYRQLRPGSVTSLELTGDERRGHQYAFYEWLAGYLDRQGYRGTEAWRLTQAALRRPQFARFRHPVLWRARERLLPWVREGRRLIARGGRS